MNDHPRVVDLEAMLKSTDVSVSTSLKTFNCACVMDNKIIIERMKEPFCTIRFYFNLCTIISLVIKKEEKRPEAAIVFKDVTAYTSKHLDTFIICGNYNIIE